jgi:hypothetical protein
MKYRLTIYFSAFRHPSRAAEVAFSRLVDEEG